MALGASFSTFRRVYNDPGEFAHRSRYQAWSDRYGLNWSYYIGSALDELARWSAYRSTNRLYRYTRNIYNPTRRLVDFYAGTVYPGVLTADARRFEDGTVIAIPFAKDTPRNLTDAIASLWKWSNWHINKGIMVRYAATTGECLVEVFDDTDSGKIEFQVWYPSTVTRVILDFRGNVKEYTIEYEYEEVDDNGFTGRMRKFKRVVDQTSIRTFRDNVPYGYNGSESVLPNPYGFAPAVWVKHTDIGTDHGEPCMRYISKWDELNSIASHWLDQAHRVLEAPLLVSGDNISKLDTDVPGPVVDTAARPDAAKANIPILKGPLGSRIEAVQPPSGDVEKAIDHLIAEIEKDHPELTMHREMRKMSQVTGPAVTRLFGDVDIMVNEARNNYDTQSVKVHQMGVAIGGYRANNGDWGSEDEMTEDQKVFLPFDLDSYRAGDLDFEIASRPLVPLGHWETVQVARSEVALEREKIILRQTKEQAANPLGTTPGLPSGDQATQIALRLRGRSATEGALQTGTPPGP